MSTYASVIQKEEDFKKQQSEIHKNPQLTSIEKADKITKIFTKRLKNAKDYDDLTLYIKNKIKDYHLKKVEAEARYKLYKDLENERRRVRSVKRAGMLQMQSLFQNKEALFLDGFIDRCIENGMNDFGNRVFIPNNLVMDLTTKYLFQKHCHTKHEISLYIGKKGFDFNKEICELIIDELKKCITEGTEVIVIRLGIVMDDFFGAGGHSNIIVFRPKIGVLERFEPHGSFLRPRDPKQITQLNLFVNDGLDYIKDYLFQQVTPDIPIRYVSSDSVCPWFGPQALSNDRIGFCTVWSTMMVNLILRFQNKSTKEIAEGVLASVSRYTIERRSRFTIFLNTQQEIASSGGTDDFRLNMMYLVQGYTLFMEAIVDGICQSLGLQLDFKYPDKDDPILRTSEDTVDSSNIILFKTPHNIQMLQSLVV